MRLVIACCLIISCSSIGAADRDGTIRFASIPDLFNWNIGNPQPGWEGALDWLFDRLEVDGADFVLNAGDIMDARWWDSPEQVRQKTEEYWLGFKRRFDERGLTVYVAPGDHEYGDDAGLEKPVIARAFGEQFGALMGMPRNGPAGHLGRAFWLRQGGLLLISLDTFEDAGKKFAYTVGPEQLTWMEEVLVANRDAAFVIVQGHLPVIGPVASKNSSASMLRRGHKSALWKSMVEHDVDVYLCGEHHRITVKKREGIWQIVHGALWGTQTDLNYLRGLVRGNELHLELLEFDVVYGGDYIGDHPHRDPTRRPREQVALTAESKAQGPRSAGLLVLTAGPDGNVQEAKRTGFFEQAVGD